MRYTAVHTTTSRRNHWASFCSGGELASAIYADGSSPGALILDHLLPVKDEGGTLETRLCRQVRKRSPSTSRPTSWQRRTAMGRRS